MKYTKWLIIILALLGIVIFGFLEVLATPASSHLNPSHYLPITIKSGRLPPP